MKAEKFNLTPKFIYFLCLLKKNMRESKDKLRRRKKKNYDKKVRNIVYLFSTFSSSELFSSVLFGGDFMPKHNILFLKNIKYIFFNKK